ncbi:XRE family transcriptional regulator [Hydrogenimonas sp.]
MKTHEKLKMLLKQKGRGSQSALARLLGEDRATISKWAHGTKPVPRNKIKRVADFLGVTIDYLLDDQQEKPMMRLIPKIGYASCGVPTDHFYDENVEYIPAPPDINTDGVYAVTAYGDSMLPKIADGEEVICDTKRPIHNKDIVHYTYEDESGIKQFIRQDDGSVMLMPLNNDCDDCKPIYIPADKTELLRAVKCVRVYKLL